MPSSHGLIAGEEIDLDLRGVSHGLLTARFGSKEGLWFAAMEHALARAEHTWREVADSPGLDDLQALRQAVVRQVLFSAAHPRCYGS